MSPKNFAKEHKDKHEKEHKEHKDHIERKHFKEFEKLKPEKEFPEKFKEDKEQPDKLKDKEFKGEVKEDKEFKDKEVKEFKGESKEIEKQIPEKGVKELVESGQPGGGVVDPAGLDPAALLAHADSLEETGRQLRHFIERSMRPDLSGGALQNEEDLTDEPAPGKDDT
jgi:hypothetical protein